MNDYKKKFKNIGRFGGQNKTVSFEEINRKEMKGNINKIKSKNKNRKA